MHQYYFEKLEVWKNSISLSKEIYSLTDLFPKEEKYGMTSQIRRSVISVSNNIVEGTSRTTSKDQKRFITIAYGSLIETLNLIILAKQFEWINQERYLKTRNNIGLISNQLNNLKKAV